MSGIGSDQPTYEPLRQALEAHAKAVYGDKYVLADFAIMGYVVSMEDDGEDENDAGEYIMASSTRIGHILDGLFAQTKLFRQSDDDD